jgi:hypothetical protein
VSGCSREQCHNRCRRQYNVCASYRPRRKNLLHRVMPPCDSFTLKRPWGIVSSRSQRRFIRIVTFRHQIGTSLTRRDVRLSARYGGRPRRSLYGERHEQPGGGRPYRSERASEQSILRVTAGHCSGLGGARHSCASGRFSFQPKGMHLERYERLRDLHDVAENQFLVMTAVWIYRLAFQDHSCGGVMSGESPPPSTGGSTMDVPP